jgi:hypothetical protein
LLYYQIIIWIIRSVSGDSIIEVWKRGGGESADILGVSE